MKQTIITKETMPKCGDCKLTDICRHKERMDALYSDFKCKTLSLPKDLNFNFTFDCNFYEGGR